MASTVIDKSPLPIGNRWCSLVDHTGPGSYTQVSTGSTPTGGDLVTAAECGLKWIEIMIVCGLDNTGVYAPDALCNLGGASDATSTILRWFTAAGMTEVTGTTSLLVNHVRLLVFGR